MIEVIQELIGVTIAGGIFYAAKEIKRTADAVGKLDARVSRLEYWLHREGIPERRRRTDDPGAIEGRGGGGEG